MSKQTISKVAGIDLGTTNSAVAVMNPTDTEIIVHRDKKFKRETTPSCVWKNPKTGDIIVGHKAFRRVGTSPKPIRSIKRSMGQQIKVLLTDGEITPEQVSSYTLGEMKRQIEEDVAAFSTDDTSWIVDRAIITVPAYFNQPQIDATRKAGELAGLTVVDLLHEPTAAACYYCWIHKKRNGVFLVYDFGGGTFDVSVLRSTEGTFEVLGVSGNNRLGGDDLDAVLAEHLQERLLEEDYALDLNPKDDPEDAFRFDKLKFLGESVKKALSTSGEFYLRDTTLQDKDGTSVIVEIMFERPEVEDLFKPIIERTIPYCFEALDRARERSGVTLADVDTIILAGGSTHVPLVREMVKQALCADPNAQEIRAKCEEPVYDKVDTIVALGAGIRAAEVGGLAVYNPEHTIRVSFTGTGVKGTKETYVGGKVEALDAKLDLSNGQIRLTIEDLDYEDEAELKEGGTFRFTKVPLQASAENLLTFEIFDHTNTLVAIAGRPISQTKEMLRPTGGKSTAVLSKAILLEVMREGKPYRKELIQAMTTLPASETFQFSHPGNTELIRLPLYQQQTKIQEIQVNVPSSLQKGTSIELTLNIDGLSFITVVGKIGDISFDAAVELPPPRKIPTNDEIQSLEKSFQEAAEYLPAGKKNVAEVRYKKAQQSFESAGKRGDTEQAVHDFEEMEELVAGISSAEGPLQPPKEFFDDLVKECLEINQYATQAIAEIGQPYDHDEIAKTIEAQRVQGEKAFTSADQKAYSDAIMMLENIRNHIIAIYQKIAQPKDTRTDAEKAAGYVAYAQGEASKMGQFAAAQGRGDLQNEIEQIQRQLSDLERDAQKNPNAVQEKVAKLAGRLEQIKNILTGKVTRPEGEGLVEDYSR